MKKITVILVTVIFILGIAIGFYLTPKKIIENGIKTQFIENTKKESPIVGVNDKGEGVKGSLTVEMKQGTGLILFNINDLLADQNAQLSARTAAKVASDFTNISLENKDLVYNLKANASVIEGTSAGSVMAILTIAALSNKKIKENIFMTGAIDNQGQILGAAGIEQKARAAKDNGAELFLIPKGEYVKEYNEDKSCWKYKEYEYCKVDYNPRLLDASDILGIKAIQVENIGEVVEFMLE